MKYSILLTASLGIAFLFSCNSGTKSDAAPPGGEAVAPAPYTPGGPRPELYLYVVNVDNLLLREQAGKSGKPIVKLGEGALVSGTGESSAQKEEVELRGIPMNEPYIKVKTGAPQQKEGWIYGGGLTLLYAGTSGEAPDQSRLAKFAAYVRLLPVKQLESGKKIWDYVEKHFSDAKGSLADAVFVLLGKTLIRMGAEGELYKEAENMAWTEEDFRQIEGHTFDMNKYPLSARYAANGFTLASAEGVIFPIPDEEKQYAFFKDKLTPPMQAYLAQQALESKEPTSDDGGLLISLEQLAERAVFWERFNTAHPYFILSAETKSSETWLGLSVLNGLDNSPAYNYETNTANEDYRKVWLSTAQKYPGTRLAQRCKELSAMLSAEGWKKTPKVEEWLEKQEETM